MKSYSKYFNAFTLAEMMVVLLIMSIVLACLAPAMTTKMKAEQNVQTSPWKWVQQGGGRNLDAYFGNGDLQMAHIGQTQRGAADNAKLVINNSDFNNLLLFKNGDNVLGHLRINNDGLNLSTENNQAITIGHNVDGGFGSVAIGSNIMTHTDHHSAPSGHYNVALGVDALSSNTFGHRNEAIGWSALSSNTTGIENIGVGVSSLLSNTTGRSNTVLGTRAGSGNTTGSNNVIIGHEANNNAVSDKSNLVVIGSGASGSADNAIAIGAGVTGEGENSVAIGSNSVVSNESAIAIGSEASASTKEGIAIGYKSKANDVGLIAIGSNTLSNNTTGGCNTAIGSESLLENTTGTYNTAVGMYSSGYNTTGNMNTAVGYKALYRSTTGEANTAVGYLTLDMNTTGKNNTAIGKWALFSNGSGSNNTAIGESACYYVSGSNKTCIGAGSGPSSGQTIGTNSANIVFLGTADSTVYIPGKLVVGKHVFLNSSEGATVLRPANGRGSLVVLRQGDNKGGDDNMRGYPTDIGDSEQTWYNTYSDRRLKYVGKENTDGLAKLRQIEVFNYTFKKDEAKTPRVGVMAQDLQKIFPNAVKKAADGFLTIRMEDMFYAVINAIKELDARVTALEKENKLLKEQNKALDARLKALEAKIK